MIFLNFEVNEKDNVTFELYDVLGKQQTISRLNATNQHQIKLSNVQPGIYFYRIVSNDAALESGKLIIE
ncbi:T9SS type A sorting domain-containing protein [bacterium]|nr:T9SS type A sorting domain-containing protein [bacterium]